MPSPVTVRLSEATRKSVAKLARRKRITPSQAFREAVEAWVQREENVPSFYDRIKDLVGIGRGDYPNRSVNTGRQFAALLKQKRTKPARRAS